jgi:hypothetical protein
MFIPSSCMPLINQFLLFCIIRSGHTTHLSCHPSLYHTGRQHILPFIRFYKRQVGQTTLLFLFPALYQTGNYSKSTRITHSASHPALYHADRSHHSFIHSSRTYFIIQQAAPLISLFILHTPTRCPEGSLYGLIDAQAAAPHLSIFALKAAVLTGRLLHY